MDSFHESIILLTLLVESGLIGYVEYKAWHSLYTPLSCLMYPYLFVLLVSIGISGRYGFVPFNYESLYVWMYGLPLFALPSWAVAVFSNGRYSECQSATAFGTHSFSKSLTILVVILSIAFAFKLRQTLGHSELLFGTDEFTDEFALHGAWPHMREFLMPLLILAFFCVGKKSKWLWLLIVPMLLVELLFMVKGAILIAIAGGLLMRLYFGKTHLDPVVIISSVAGGVGLFFLIYMVMPLLGSGEEADSGLVEFVMKHFLHYFTSGTMGFSYDLDRGLPDVGHMDIILSPFINLFNAATGESKMLTPVNPIYFNTGITLTNVRTFFGTLYIYSNVLEFVVYTLSLSTIIYLLKIWATMSNNIFTFVVYFYYCGLLAMGWFEFYFFHLSVIEIPVLTVMLCYMVKYLDPAVSRLIIKRNVNATES